MQRPEERDRSQEFYTVPEAAELLAVSQTTIWRWIEARRLPAYRIGPRRIRIRREDLQSVIRPVGERPMAADKRDEDRDIWAGYDPERVRRALRQSAGALAGVDRQALMADLHDARQQASIGRSD